MLTNYLDAEMLRSEIDELPGLDAEDDDEREWRFYRQSLLALAVDYEQNAPRL